MVLHLFDIIKYFNSNVFKLKSITKNSYIFKNSQILDSQKISVLYI